jgi:ABC-2 type transport system ATP-binding protein
MEITAPIVSIENLGFEVRRKALLKDVSYSVLPGAWLAVLGENGAGKTTLLDLIMGFKKPTSGRLTVFSHEPAQDNAELRRSIAYLSEKVDIPGDWSVGDFLEFNRYFYPTHDSGLEAELSKTFRVSKEKRVGALSAGEIRRSQWSCPQLDRTLLLC